MSNCSDETRARHINSAMESIRRCAELAIEYCDRKLQVHWTSAL